MKAHTAPQTRVADVQLEIAAPPDAVWRALTDATELTRWFPLEAGVNPDGTEWMAWRDQFRFSGRTDAAEPQRYLRSVPILPPEFTPPVPMVTEFFLEAARGSTVVRVVQSGFLADRSWDEEFDGVRRGWIFQLASLKHYLERHRGTPRHVAWARKFIAVPQAEAWQRVSGPHGLGVNLAGAKSGDAVRFVTIDADSFECALQMLNPPLDFSGVIANWNDALLRVQFDHLPMRGYSDAQLWLATWGVPAARVESLESRWTQMLARLFPEPVMASAHP